MPESLEATEKDSASPSAASMPVLARGADGSGRGEVVPSTTILDAAGNATVWPDIVIVEPTAIVCPATTIPLLAPVIEL